jgi:4-amino-4-deoxy-L-arabinose transferase-like glycosyltransferase
MRHRILLVASLVYLCATNIVWIARDTRPPFWDMANHANWAMSVLRNFQQNGVASAIQSLPHDTGGYPPFYYLVIALFYRIFGLTIDTAQLANIPAIILLGLATYGIARYFMDPTAAALAGALVNSFPFMLWISRETLLEYWLVTMVAISIWALLKSKQFSSTKWSLLFGVTCGFGMLTKWTFAIFVAAPALWAARKNWGNALKAAAVAGSIAAFWYVPQLATIPEVWRRAAAGGQNEGDPGSLSLQGWLFYIRGLEGSLLFLPLFIAFLMGVSVVARRGRSDSFSKWTPLVLYLLFGWLGLLLLPNKDPRYAVPLLPGVAVVTTVAFERKKTAQIVLVGFLVFQHALVSFGIPLLPERVTLIEGPASPVRYDWNLYTQTYFGLWGRPEQQDWQIEHVLNAVLADAERAPHPVKLGLIPDLPRFDLQAFQFAIELNRYPVVLSRAFAADESDLLGYDYLLMSLGQQTAFGSPAPHAAEINAYIFDRPERFRMVDTFTLPSGETIRLYRCVR